MVDSRVAAFLQERLKGVDPLAFAVSTKVRARVVVPVYGESLGRVLALLESLAQQEIDKESYEVIVVVNQPVPNGTSVWRTRYSANQLLLDAPLWSNRSSAEGHTLSPEVRAACATIREKLTALVVDASSRGNEISDLNIGRVRNRGLAEAVMRFMREEQDGLVVSTDADAIFADETLLGRAIEAFERDRSISAISGGVEMFFDPDTHVPEKRNELRKRFDWYVLQRRWQAMVAHLLNKKPDMPDESAFFGGLILMRAFDAARMGGFRDMASREDSYFGKDLATYVQERGLRMVDGKRHFRVRAAFRESERTPGSVGAHVMRDPLGSAFVKHPLTGQEEPLSKNAVERLISSSMATEEGRRMIGRLEDISMVLYADAFAVRA